MKKLVILLMAALALTALVAGCSTDNGGNVLTTVRPTAEVTPTPAVPESTAAAETQVPAQTDGALSETAAPTT